jgi:uncharacterized protein YqgV (UPF0045/DUF77 family)
MIGISAQVSLYPLRQQSLSPAIEQAMAAFEQHDVQVEPGSMSTVLVGDDSEVFGALQAAFRQVAEQGHAVMVVTVSNACPVPAGAEDEAQRA